MRVQAWLNLSGTDQCHDLHLWLAFSLGPRQVYYFGGLNASNPTAPVDTNALDLVDIKDKSVLAPYMLQVSMPWCTDLHHGISRDEQVQMVKNCQGA